MPVLQTEYEKITDEIRDAILRGDFTPGQRLPQRKLAEQFETTTITVREALRALSNDGLVEIAPKWGAMVVELSIEKLKGQYVVREALEGMAAGLAAVNMNQVQREALLKMADKCDARLPSPSLTPHQKAELHYSLHELVAEYSGCPELLAAIKRSNVFSLLLANAYHDSIEEDPPGWHRKLAEAIVAGKAEEAERGMRAHIRRGFEVESKKLS